MRTWESSRKRSGVTEGMAVSQELGCSRKEGAVEVRCKARGLEAAAARGKEGPNPPGGQWQGGLCEYHCPAQKISGGVVTQWFLPQEGKTDVHRNG